ncbi:DNA-dependent protein kinase catalytic subunit [Channa argus]|uniref:DNA-dependent protein kinase catalytic subunit n=1 Tax=Channa argus TaxID=215402 RepID=A0A6G1QL08_CHAAH|nr:DNA-dependent protein kinase catalytic subunit [Channa argus]
MSSQCSTAGGIHGLLLKLHESLSDEDSRAAALKCHDIIGDLGQDCMLTATENELGLQASLLFAKDYGLLSFLRKSLPLEAVGVSQQIVMNYAETSKIPMLKQTSHFQLRDTRIEILSFLETFLDKVSPWIKGWEKTYAVDIRDMCMAVYTKEKFAKSRTSVLELLIKLLQTTKDSSVAADFKIRDIFSRFYSELYQKSKLPDSVLGKIYELLGVLAEVHPSEMVDNSDKLYKAFLLELKEQMTSSTKEPKLFVVAGCLRGITALMVNFPKSMEEDPATSKEIFQYALKAISPQMEMSRYAVTFAGLRLFARHASQFSSCLLDHYRALFEVMSKLCGHINAEMKKTSYYALEAFLKQVAVLVAENIEEHKSKLKFFMQKFCGIIKTMDSTHKELSIAIRGYGFFAAPCKKVCPQDVDLMYTELIQRCKQMYLTESDGEDDSFYQLPSFLDSIASVLIHLDKIPEVYTPLLERLIVVQIDSFPQYSERMQTVCSRSILKVLVAIASKGPVLWSFISSVENILCNVFVDPLQDSGFFDGAFESQNSAVVSLSRLLYDELVKSILRIVEKLDLSVQKVTTGDEDPRDAAHVLPSTDPTAHLLPSKVKDFTAFINLVDFCSELLLTKHVEYFQSWMYPLSHELILHSIRNPLVSGFYKLLSVTMKIAKRIKYYQVCVRTKQYKDELLASCLTFILSLHHNIVALDIKAYCPALEVRCFLFVYHGFVGGFQGSSNQAALKLGLSHVPLANAALDALEDWSSHISLEIMQPCYTNILPLLDGYLKAISKDMVSSEEMMKKFVAWDSEKRLSFAVPFADIKPVIYLDPFLPRISELALSTSDRQTKVAACELLHSLVVYMVGKSAQMVEDKSSLPPMYKLHKRLFPVLLRLACDVDQVTRQLFEPLVMQLIHWFTNNKKFESQDTVAVLEAILDGVVDPMDSTLRDFCGRCIEEFVKWSIKQTTPKQQEKSPTNMKSLFKRIYSLALHPGGFKRLGAALAFNSIYRQFREENSLVDQFVFEILVIFVESLALAHADERSMGTLQQCGIAIDHLKRIINKKAPSLNQHNAKRRIPRGFPSEKKLCLSDVVLWLLEQCGRPQTECRHKCMELFYEFVSLLPGKKSLPQWLDALLRDHGVDFLISQFEGGGLLSQPTLKDLAGPFSVRVTLQWMDLLLAALDCYNTFIRLHLIKPQHMLSFKDKSSFLKAISFFLTELATNDLAAAESCFHHSMKTSHFSPREVEQYNCSKCTIIVRLLEFATMVLVKGDPEFLKDSAYVQSLGSQLLMTVYKGIAPGEDRKALPSLDINTRRVADGLLQLAFCLSQQSEQLVDLLLNTIMLSVPISGNQSHNFFSFSHGEYFYSLFQTTINTELLRNLYTTAPHLMQASSQNSSMIDSSVCSNINHEAFRPVFSTFTQLLVDTNLPLNLKSQALLVLPFFTTLPEEQLSELQRALDALVASHFPMQSDEFAKGSLQRNNYMDCIRKLLDALELSQSPLLLKRLARILCQDRKHIMEEQFQVCFQRIAKRNLYCSVTIADFDSAFNCLIRSSNERQLQLLCTVYGVIQQGDVPMSSMLQAMMERVLLPLASHCSTQALNDFFVANVCNIMELLLNRFTKSNQTAFEIEVLKKNGCYKLMELLYSRLPKDEVYSKESRINQAYCRSDKPEGNEMSKTLIKSCFEAYTENMAGETQLLELRRLYHCAAYNCAIAVICCSFNESKFYQGFLFSEKPEKNQFILENIIDVKRTYNFPIEIEVPLERKKKYTMIRKELSEENGEAPVYLSSQSYMADSSLSEEMSQFDFSTGVQSFSFSSQNPEGQRRTIVKKETEETNISQDAMVDLEMDELNQHECMATLTALIGHMQRNNIIAKTEQIFRPYAKHWLGPLVNFVVSGNNGGEGVHFMVVDIVVTVLSWTSLASPKGNPRDEVLANRLLEFLMKHSFHSKRAVFRHNLEIIRTLVECWKDCLHVPYSLIYERFCGTDPNSKDNSVGLQLLGIILANNLPAYDASCGIEYDRYIQSLTNNMSFVRYKDVYSAAAEIIGLTLKNMTDMENQRQELLNLAATKITNLKKNDMDDKFIICLNKVSKHFPSFMDRFVNYVFFLLPKLHGLLKTHCLECVLSRADVIPDIFLQLKTTGFIEMMSHRDEARQRVCLDLIHKIIARLTPVELQELLGAVTAFVSHPSPVCRERMYDILMWIQDNYSDPESMSDSTSAEVLNAAKETLIQGLSEENPGLQLYVRNFWSQERRLPTATLKRMQTVLCSLYSCKIERGFLSLATNLLLEMTSQSPDFKRNMFEYPLSECTFQDYVIDSNWRFRSTVMTPMFVETQSSQGPESVAASQSGALKGKLRATQTSLEFSQTQTAGRRTAYNWLTGSSVDTLAEYTVGSESLSSLLVFDKKAERQAVARRPVGEGFGLRRLTASTDEGDSRTRAQNEQRNNILRLRRRFLKDQEKVRLAYAQKEIRQQKQKKEEHADQRLQKEAQVTLYRNYRVGDFPDIQIPYSSIIAPLQALAQRDPILAKQLFSSLFAGILQEMKVDPKEHGRIKEELRCNMNAFLSESTICFPPFIACVLDMCYQHKEMQQLDPAAISSTCLVSLQQPSAILLLEESLLHSGVQEEPPAKRSRGRKEVPPDTKKWIHLAKLYRSLEDYDVVRGIFGGKVGTKSITSAALQAEANSDFAEAAKLYNEEMYLQHMIRSMLKQLQLGERDQTLLSFIDKAMKKEEHKKVLESHYSQELSLLYILQEDYDRAKYYTNYAMQLFMESYSSVDTLLTQSRLTLLQSVQALTEIQDFLQFIKGNVSVSSLKRLMSLWTERYPDSKVDPVNIWDDIITSRCFFLDKVREQLRSHAPSDTMEVDGSEDPAGDVDTLINDCKFRMKLRMADSALKQNNFPVATKLLKELHREAKTNKGWLMRWVHSFSRYSHKRSQAQGPVEQIDTMLKTVPLLEDLQVDCQSAAAKVFRYQKILQGTSYHILAKAVSRSPSLLGSIEAEKAQRVVSLSGAAWPSESTKKVEVGLHLRALKLLCDASRKADEELQSYTQECVETSSIVETYMMLANFADKLLREEEQDETESQFPDLLALPVHVVEAMLKALKMNSEEARLKFPRLLQIIELYPTETLDLMTKEMMSVPCWMLISWISQMVALLDKPEAVAVQHSIGQIAEFYPQALVYAVMISSETYQFEDSATGHKHKEFVDRLRSTLDKGGAVKNFVDALQQLTNPEMIFRDWWESVKNEMEKASFNQKQMGDMYDEMRSLLGDPTKDGHGMFRKKFIQKFAKKVEGLLGPKGRTLFDKRKDKTFARRVDELAQSMRESNQGEPGNLKEYSPWLSGFKADSFCNELEIPGQYDGRSKPLPEYHAKITGFDERVKVMTSIRRPKRLIIRGDDEQDHPFLVKGGEDLRQDQRIEQLFGVMNILLSHDAACTHRDLQLHTYQVIPITTRVGLIEWMENTCTLKEFLYNTMTPKENETTKRCPEIYSKWLSTFSNAKNLACYGAAYKKATRAETVSNFLKLLQHVPSDLLKRAFLKMCNSPEAFLFLRTHFISSHALLCVSHWILGIGDRHLSNFMINMETGGMIGIDFGHAFGSATQFLPVPELMPFRLTRQFVNLMEPLKESGLIQSIMVHSLRAYRAEPDLLLNTMDVFVKEPSLDWKNFELKQLKKGGTWMENVNTKEINWFPLQKVNFARRKLEGANPAVITRYIIKYQSISIGLQKDACVCGDKTLVYSLSEELKLGFEKDSAFPDMQSVALGTEEHNIRAKLPAAGLSVEQQVDCLLDQAVDPNVLGRVYGGWEPWF